MNRLLCGLTLFLLAGILGTAAVLLPHGEVAKHVNAAPREEAAECRWTDTPIELDGKDDEPAWKHAQLIENFGQPWTKDRANPLRGKTRAKLLWDRDYLYFFAEMEDSDLFADITEHDGELWKNDAFELFFRPGPNRPGYFEFQVNAANAVFDAFFPKFDLDSSAVQARTGEFRVETKVRLRGTLNKRDDRDEGWSVEGRIPWADFLRAGGRPVPGEEWRFNLARCNHDKDQPEELTATAPLREKKLSAFFHQIEDYAPLRFVGPTEATSLPRGIPRLEPVDGCTVLGSPEPPLPYRAKRLYPNYAPTYPILAKAIPGTDQLIVISENRPWGVTTISRLPDTATVRTEDAVKLLETPGNGTVYDLCFHPKFAENGYIYVGWNGDHKTGVRKKKASRITRYTMRKGPPLTIDEASARLILEWESDGHNGAAVCFGLDGMLYVTTGDGTSDSDADEMGQRTDTMLSKLLRIDVDHPDEGKAYSIPKDNPYVNDPRFVPETWAYGFRNPWRITCDEKTGHIWVGQNGQDLWEQAYLIQKGANYGWSVTEGSHPFYPLRKAGPTPILNPTIEHHHAEFRSLTGGIVLHGNQLPDLKGAYIYGDYSTGRIWAMLHDGTRSLWHKELASPRLAITAFGQSTRGELLICDHSPTGGLYTLERSPPEAQSTTFPRKLSQSGLFDDLRGHRLKPGVIPYSVNAPFWSDGMHKERYLYLPTGTTIEYTRTRGWNFPDNTVIIKSFAVEREEGNRASRQWIETRFLTKQQGEWFGYSYLWNDQGTDADLLPAAGTDRTFRIKTATGQRDQVWHYPSRTECMVCHSRAANFVLGLCSLQMNKPHFYGDVEDNQLRLFEELGVLRGFDWSSQAREEISHRATSRNLQGKEAEEYNRIHGPQAGQREPGKSQMLPTSPRNLPRLVDPYDSREDLTLRARSWLHTNCSSCHVEAGGGNAQMELEFSTPLDKMRLVDVKPVHSSFGIVDARLVAPGTPSESVLVKRISLRGRDQMPPLSTNRADAVGIALLQEWIKSMKK